MAFNEQEKTVIKHRNSIFSWTFEICEQDMHILSDAFYFCGNCCYLKLISAVRLHPGGPDIDISISLHGYPSPCKKNVSCQYSLFMKNDEGQFSFNKTGEIHTLEDVIDIDLFTDRCRYNDVYLFSSTIFFSWFENGDYEVFSQGTQTKPERSVHVLERGTQTDGACISPTSELIDNAENESYKFLQILSNDFSSLHESMTDPDCVLKVGEVKFKVHRTVLSARSTVFAAMFHHDTSESRSGEVVILDTDGDVFGDVLYYIYTGKIRGLAPDTAASMYIVSDKYALIEFRDKCLNYLMLNLNVDNVGDAALLAHAHAEIQLETGIIQFIEENLEDLMLNETWIRFSDAHLKLANKLLCSASLAIKKKFQKSHLS